MRSKRLLTILLAACLLVSCIAPCATAVTNNTASVVTDKKANNDKSSALQNNLIVSDKDSNKVSTLRDKDVSAKPQTNNASTQKGSWTATPTDKRPSVELPSAELPSYLAELREAAKIYADDQKVSAFVVMEDAPLIQFYGINSVPADEEELLQMQQEAVVMLIEEDVLDGQTLEVTDQFTYVTNSIVITTEFGNLEEIAKIPGVKSVFLTPVYQACTTTGGASPYTVSAGAMSNVPDVWNGADLGYTGTGMTIAIIDTGLDMDHPSFAADPAMNEYSWDVDYVASKLSGLNAALINPAITAEDLYMNAKVPFTFNYVTGTKNVNHDPDVGDHGSHVAGIAAANAVEGTNVVGMAPDAQLVIMQVFTPGEGAQMHHILAALEDAMALGCDVANLSLGSPAGFSSMDPEVDAIYARIAESDIIVDIAAGNEGTSSYGNMWGTDLNLTAHPDNATISSPSTFVNAMSVASIDNKVVPGNYFSLSDGTEVYYMDSVEYLMGDTDVCLADLAGQDLEYVFVPGLGSAEDYAQVDVAGKIAVVKRGELSFHEKAVNGENAGAVAVIIWNNNSEYIFNFGMTTAGEDGYIPGIPVALITLEDGTLMEAAESKTLTVSEETGFRADIYGGQVSSFSSWGVSPDLRLLPDISGVGGNVYSCYDGGQYGLMSGTSMASPQVAGVTALVLQYLREKFPNATEAEIRVLVDSLMMSTAVPTISDVSGVEASPRQQGAGLANALYAVTSEAYLTVNGSNRPKAELFDNKEGTYSFTFKVHNFGTEEKTYTLSSSLLCEDAVGGGGYYFMAGYDRALSGTVSFSQNSVTVAPGAFAEVTVSIALSEEDKALMDAYFVNGNYVEGYIYLTAEEGVNMSLPFLGFYGDWTDAPVFDTAYWYQNNFWEVETALPEGNEYFHVLWTDLMGTPWVLGFNPYMGTDQDENGNIIYDPANNVISNNGDGLVDNFNEVYLSLMRNAREVTMTYTDEQGNVVYEEISDYVNKTMYISAFGQVVPYLRSWWYMEPYDFTDENGDPLPHGTKLTLTVSGVLDYEGAEKEFLKEIPITVDVEAPVLVGELVESSEDGVNYLTFTVSDDALAYVALMNPEGTRYLAELSDSDVVKNDDGTYTVQVDVTGFGNEMVLVLADYGCNESYMALTYTAENDPVMDTSALYAYRINDAVIEEEYGYDFMFGWVTLGKEDAAVTELTSDFMEYYALTAAEYAGGYVFAVDAGGNFLVMKPGLWNRRIICNLGVSACDMAFDETSGTMYLSAKAENYWGDKIACLYTIDLTTGALELLRTYDSEYDMPYAMTVVDGTIYAIKNYNSGFYTVNAETYELEKVLDAEGNDFQLQTSAGKNIVPYYAQSMTYSAADGKIYWAYCSYSGLPELFAINPADLSYTSVPFATSSEYIGLLVLEDDGYTLPESDTVESLVLSDESLLLEGDMAQLTVSPLPWNAPMGELTWTSSDESIAVVDEYGVVTAVSEGSAEITVACGDVEAYCVVNVVKIQGTIYAYNYFDLNETYGNWVSVDLNTMGLEDLYASPVDFIAADYNGHDGNIYGYDMNGQFYCFNPETGDCTALGAPSGIFPQDMAYDYSTGFMYAIVADPNAWTTTLYYVNMKSGAMTEVAMAGDVYMTLACDTEGGLYAVSGEGVLYSLFLYESDFGGGGIMPWSAQPASANMMIEPTYILEGFDPLNYQQSMCFDHNTRKLVWAQAEAGTLYWIDPFAMEPYAVSLGDPTGSGLFEFVGMFTIPTEIPELTYKEVVSVTAEDVLVMVGGVKAPAVTIDPLNATNQDITWTSEDESVAYIDETGMVVGAGLGTTVITGTLVDGDNTFEVSFKVSVKESAGDIYGYVAADFASGAGQIWAAIPDYEPGMPNYLAFTDYMFYSEEYLDGKLYGYAYDPYDWEANFQYTVVDPETFEILSMTDMGDGFPFVYDMTFDYTTGTMYAVAGYNDSSSDLYMVNVETGELIPVLQIESFIMSIAASAEGELYGICASVEEYDPLTWTSEYSNSMLYKLDPVAGTCEALFDLGAKCNLLGSMAFDFDTGNLYWSQAFRASFWDPIASGLYLIDLENEAAFNLGAIGTGGSQVTGMYIPADNYPETPDELCNFILSSSSMELLIGESDVLEYFVQPFGYEVEPTYTSADESVATVDENGNVTAVGAGVTVITVTVEDNGKTFTAQCVIIVFSEDDYILSYNRTAHGWSEISRVDPTVVNAANEDDADVLDVRAAAMVDGVIYGYDVENGFFTTSAEAGFERTYLGQANVETNADEDGMDFFFEVRDMTYDPTTGKMYAIGCESVTTTTDYDGYLSTETYELTEGCFVYEVDLTTGALTELFNLYTSDGGYIQNLYAIACTDNGDFYIYSSYDDYISSVDMETGLVTHITTYQNQGVYGDSAGNPMAMVYDPITCDIYMLFTPNGEAYYLYRFDTADKSLSLIGDVTDCYDLYATLLIDAEHIHAWTEWEITAEPTEEEPGEKQHKCLICGEIETEEIPATAPSTEPTEPEVTVPETTEPEVTEPETTEPETTEPEATQKPTEKPGTGDNVQTGDGFASGMWTAMLLISIAGVAFLLTFRKKLMV